MTPTKRGTSAKSDDNADAPSEMASQPAELETAAVASTDEVLASLPMYSVIEKTHKGYEVKIPRGVYTNHGVGADLAAAVKDASGT